jgi:hypothetical protein
VAKVVLEMPDDDARDLMREEREGNRVFFGSPWGDGWYFELKSVDDEPFEYGSREETRGYTIIDIEE